jgi:hypothetical protein
LIYDEVTASIRGTVLETLCGYGPIDSVPVMLHEIPEDPEAVRRVRTALTDRSGQFEIGGLEPGIPHAVRFGLVDTHTVHTDTLVFSPGERLDYDVGLQRLTPCGLAP